MSTSIKVSNENYERLCEISGKLQEKLKKPVSLNDAITHLQRRTMIEDLIGSWDLSDEEAKMLSKELREGWKAWNKKHS